jgi:energy-coupling factor transport system ATP-binding protein
LEPIVQAHNLWHQYPNGVTAIQDVNVEIASGDYIALIGRNGSGKTTLVKHFNGLLRPTKGSVIVKGLDTRATRSESLARVVGYAFQNPDYMLFSTSIEQEVEFGPRNLDVSEDEIRSRVDEALAVTGLSQHRKENPLFFGKGVRRMITIAAILSMQPDVLVIDEPTTGMDYRGRESVMELIDRLNALGKTIIIITHDMRVVADHSSRALVMSGGRIVLDTPTSRLFESREALGLAGLQAPQRVQLALELGWADGIPTIEEVTEIARRRFQSKNEVA